MTGATQAMGMDIDPLETIEEVHEDGARDKRNARLNARVAVPSVFGLAMR